MGVDDSIFDLFITEIGMTIVETNHIMCSDICKQMRMENNKIAWKICKEVRDAIAPIRDRIENAEKWDECIIVAIYVRKWNDIIVWWDCWHLVSSSTMSTDRILALDKFSDMLSHTDLPTPDDDDDSED